MNETTRPAIVPTLSENILAGESSPGQRLVETPFAQWPGVSRTPQRYALSELSSGLVERSGGRATADALKKGASARMEAWMKEHARISKDSLNLSLPTLPLIAGAA